MIFKNVFFIFTLVTLVAILNVFSPSLINSFQWKINIELWFLTIISCDILLFIFLFWPIRKVVLNKEY